MAAQQILVLFVQVRVLVEQQKKPDPLRLFCSSFLQDFLRLSPPLQFQEVYYGHYYYSLTILYLLISRIILYLQSIHNH